MKKPKQHKVWTVQDMIDCTNEDNIDNFITDLKKVIEIAHEINKLSEALGAKKGESKGFVWIDDGKNNMTLELNTKFKEETK